MRFLSTNLIVFKIFTRLSCWGVVLFIQEYVGDGFLVWLSLGGHGALVSGHILVKFVMFHLEHQNFDI